MSSHLPRYFTTCAAKTSRFLSVALLLLGGLGFWQTAAGSVAGTGDKSGAFGDGARVAFGLPGEHSSTAKRTGERQSAQSLEHDDGDSLFWLADRTSITIPILLSNPVPAGVTGTFGRAALYLPQVPRAPPQQ